MKKVRTLIAALAMVMGGAGAEAAIVPAPNTTANGGLFLLNSTTGVVSFCYVIINGQRGCSAVATFANVTANTKVIASPGVHAFIVEPSTGQTMVCYSVLNGTIMVPTCLTLATRLP